jgi:hypothetical protein
MFSRVRFSSSSWALLEGARARARRSLKRQSSFRGSLASSAGGAQQRQAGDIGSAPTQQAVTRTRSGSTVAPDAEIA